MADYAHDKTDKMIEELEKKIKREFSTAQKETAQKLKSYLKKVEAQKKVQEELLKAGKITQKDFDDWLIRKTAMGKRWEELRDNLSQDMTNANVIARSIADGYKADVYALNHNFALYQVESGGKCSTVYQLYDRSTVERLMRENQKLMPPPGKRVKAGIANGTLKRWNNKKLQSVLTQSILQGESIPETAERIAAKMAVSNYKDSVRYARTMMTGAENAGRNDGYNWAADQGVHLKKEWIATLDDRTRASHAMLHGERVATDEKFSNDLEYPGDPSGDDEEVWNCRCTMKVQIEGFETDTVTSSPKMGEMTFEEWQESRGGKPNEPEPQPSTPFSSPMMQRALGKDAAAFFGLVEGAENRGLYDQFSDTPSAFRIRKGGGTYSPRSKVVEADYANRPGQSRYSTVGHEYGHHFDAELGRTVGTYGEVDAVNAAVPVFGRPFLDATPSQSDEFLGALRKDMEAIRPGIKDGSVRAAMLASVETRNATSGVQDALDGFFHTQSKGQLPWGHGDRYYNRVYNGRIKGNPSREQALMDALKGRGLDAGTKSKVKEITRQYEAASEAWANVSSAVTCGGSELEAMEKWMPETMKAYRALVGGV